MTRISAGECHNAVRRMRLAHLILADQRRPATDVLRQFLIEGAPFAFPPVIGRETVGVETAYSAAAFREIIGSSSGFVWPSAEGVGRGQSLTPLYPGAPWLATNNQALYEMLTIIDALRVGTSRIRGVAAGLLTERLNGPAS